VADVTLSTQANSLEQRFRKFVKQQNRPAVTLTLLEKRSMTGKNAAWDVELGTATGQVFDDGADVSTFNADSDVPAVLQWGEYGDAFAVTGRVEDASANESVEEIARLYQRKLETCGDRTADKINVDIWGADGSGSPQKLHGLTHSSGPLAATGTYATIDRSVQPQWASNLFTNGGVPRAVNLSILEAAERDTLTASGRTPRAYVTTPAIWQALAEILAPNRRWLQEVMIRGQKITLDGGWSAVEFNGKPVFKDPQTTAGCFAGLDLDHLFIGYLPVAPSRIARGDVIGFIPVNGTPQEMGPTAPPGGQALMAAVSKLARAGNKTKIQVLSTIALCAERCNSSFLIKDLVPA
jgi:hypothetical protein